MQHKKIISILALAGLCMATASFAATAAGTINVSATVTQSCTINSPNVAFGAAVPATGNVNTNSTVQVTCTAPAPTGGTPFAISTNGGQSGGTAGGIRYMKDTKTGNTIPYNLYAGTGATIWGNSAGTNQLTVIIPAAATSSPATTFNANIPKASPTNYSAGVYADAVEMTATY